MRVLRQHGIFSFLEKFRDLAILLYLGSQPKSLPDSAVGLWLQQEKMVRRVCHRVTTEKVHTGSGQTTYRTRLVEAKRDLKWKRNRSGVYLQAKSLKCEDGMRRRNGRKESLEMKPFPSIATDNLLVAYKFRERDGPLHPQICLATNLCIVSPSEVTTIRNLNGLQDFISAMNCTCAPRERGCRRVSAEHEHFRGTKYETRVDIGQCIRRCRVHGSRDISCKPTAFKSVTVVGPNGAKCVQVVQSCSCEGKCYRVSHKEAVQVQHNSTNSTKVIEVGRCVGGCLSHVKGHCLYWANIAEGTGAKSRRCLFRTKTRPKRCQPKSKNEINVGDSDCH
ncbi:uncharacterized protein [Porites lutea]|uniref:uncharacterized protein n=1 Tax=Porites lutea TaxID=51062 RepID=UPI003CC5A18D